MNDIYFIVITVVFGLFVFCVMWWLYKYMSKRSILETKFEDLRDDEKLLMSKFCEEMRKNRLASANPVVEPVSKSSRKKLV